MDARDRFRDMLRDVVGPALREQGYKGSGTTWRKQNEHGDWAIVSIQKSAYGTADNVSFFVELALVSDPVVRFESWFSGREIPKQPRAKLWVGRLERGPYSGPPNKEGWEFGDGRAADAIGNAVVEQLLSEGIPILDRMLDRTYLLERLAEREGLVLGNGHINGSRPVFRALILCEGGPSKELDSVLTLLASLANEGAQDPTHGANEYWARKYRAAATWCRERAVVSVRDRGV